MAHAEAVLVFAWLDLIATDAELADFLTLLALRAVERQLQDIDAEQQRYVLEPIAAIILRNGEIKQHFVSVEFDLPTGGEIAGQGNAVEFRRLIEWHVRNLETTPNL